MSLNTLRKFLLAGSAALIGLGAFFFTSCNTADEGGHSYLKVHVDSSWIGFDSLQVLLDHGDGKPPERIFGGKILSTSDLNQVQVDGYDGGKVTIVIRAYTGKIVSRQENRKYDGAAQKTLEVVIIKDTVPKDTVPKDTVPKDTAKDALHLAVTPLDTLISIGDSAAFAASAGNDYGKVAKAEWDVDGDGTVDITQNPDLNSAKLAAGFRFAKAGTYHPTLTIQGAKGATLKATLTVRVVEDKPVADAGKDTTVTTGSPVALKGTAKDSLGKIVKQEWSIAGAAYAVTADGKASFTAAAAPGDIKAVFRVTDDDGLSSDDTVIVHVVSPLIANLTQLTLQGCPLAPAFSPDVLAYGCAAPFGTASVILTAKAQGTMTLNGKALEDGKAGDAVAFASGKALLTVVVANGASTKTYTVNATVATASGNDALSALALTGGTLAPVFAADQLAYTATVGSAVASVTVAATVADTTSSLTIQGANAVSGKAASVPVALGPNVITVIVKAQNGQMRNYTLTVTRQSGDASLHSFTVAPGAFAPAFAAGTLSYAMTVGSAVTSLTVNATPQDSGKAFMTLNGAALISGKATAAPITSALTTLTIVVTAEDQAVKRTYVLKVTRLEEAPPTAPVVALGIFAAPDRPTWTWTGGGGGSGNFRFKLDDSSLATGATPTTSLSYLATADLAGGTHTLYVQEANSSGTWSASGKAAATLTVLKTIANYPLDGHGSDTSGTNGDLALRNVPFISQGIYINGISGSSLDPTYSDAWSPTLDGFDTASFAAEIDFKSDLLPGTTRPILVGGPSYRWIGGLLDPDGKISLTYNNINIVKGTVAYVSGEWHTLRLEYAGGVAKAYLDGVLSASMTVKLIFGSDYSFGVSNPGDGSIFKGNVRNLKAFSKGVKIAQFPLSGNGKDITRKQSSSMIITNAPFQSPGPGILCAGVYPSGPGIGNEAATPNLAALDLTDFAISGEFSISSLPTVSMPIIVGGAFNRWLGALISPTGNLSMLYDNSLNMATTVNCSLDAKHTVTIRYSAARQMAALYFDGAFAGAKVIPTLTTSNERNLSTSDNATTRAFKGTLYRIKVDSK